MQPRLANESIFRADLAHSLAENRPRLICGRAPELNAILRSARPIALSDLVKFSRSTILCMGTGDKIVGGLQKANKDNYAPEMERVGGMDCAMAAIGAAISTFEPNGFKSACTASLIMRVAGEKRPG